jgi:hypothetical protein
MYESSSDSGERDLNSARSALATCSVSDYLGKVWERLSVDSGAAFSSSRQALRFEVKGPC